MDWLSKRLSKIFEGSSYKGQHHGRYGEDIYWDEPRRSMDDSSGFDRYWDEPRRSTDDSSGFDGDEIACALALSLSEQVYKGKKVIEEDDDSNLSDEDAEEVERLARAEEEERRARAEEEEERQAKAAEEERHARAEEEERHAREEEDEKRLRAQLEEDEQLAIALQESLIERLARAEEEERRAGAEEEEERRAKAAEEERRARAEEEERCARAEEDEKRLRAQLEEDEQLARALQESLSVDSPPRYDYGNAFSPFPFPFPSSYNRRCKSEVDHEIDCRACINVHSFFKICAGCNAEIGHGRFLSCMGAVWHPECFRCNACNQPITDHEFSMSNNRPYHKSCYKERHHPRCDVCNNFIPTSSSGLIEYRAHPFWGQKYCPSHERDGTPRCCSCERIETRDTRYLSLDDGRKLCLECLDSAIMDTHECQPLYFEIRDFYEGLNMKVEQQVPLLLVERSALNEAMEGEKNGHHHLPETRGLCLSEEHTITTVSRRPRIGAGYRFIDLITEPYRLSRRCEVTAILILYGLPRLLTGSILAHEMMHAWLRLKGYPNLKPEVEEGICQVLAHMWLDSEIYSSSGDTASSSSASSSSSSPSSASSSSTTSSKKGKRSDFEKKLGEFFKHQIENDSSSAYGDGFRSGNRAVTKYGLRNTLEHIRMTGSFPE